MSTILAGVVRAPFSATQRATTTLAALSASSFAPKESLDLHLMHSPSQVYANHFPLPDLCLLFSAIAEFTQSSVTSKLGNQLCSLLID